MVYVKREVELTRQQNKYYKELKNKMTMQAAGEQITAVNAAVGMNKLLQISAGAVYTDDGESLEFDIKHRYKVLREVIDESSKKVLVFVPFKHVIDILADKLTLSRVSDLGPRMRSQDEISHPLTCGADILPSSTRYSRHQ